MIEKGKMTPFCFSACPHCDNDLPVSNIIQGRKAGEVRGRCPHCKKWIQILLPAIKKKLVYLDQSFLSDVCLHADTPKAQRAVHLLSKIHKLKALQKIVVVISDTHSRETSAIPDKYIEDERKLWQFQNDLANGHISVSWGEVFVAQQRRMFDSQEASNCFPLADIGLGDPHWMQIGTMVQLSNHWQPKLHRDYSRPRDAVNEEFREIIKKQAESVRSSNDAHDCLNYIRELWHADIHQGIEYWRKQREFIQLMEHWIKELDAGRTSQMPTLEEAAPFHRIVKEVIQGLDEELAIQNWMQSLDGNPVILCASLKIRTAFEAALLWKWRTGCPPSNSETFDKNFGLSRQNDIDHISAFAPYVDVLTVDNNTRKLCEEQMVSDELASFSCKFFSADNYNEFEIWLDMLLKESPNAHCSTVLEKGSLCV